MNINLTLLMQAVAFGVFIWFCAKFIWPYLMRAIEERQKQIADGLAAGEEGRQSLTRGEKRSAEMLTEAKTRASDIVAQGEKLKSHTVDQARTHPQAEGDVIATASQAESPQSVQTATACCRTSGSSSTL